MVLSRHGLQWLARRRYNLSTLVTRQNRSIFQAAMATAVAPPGPDRAKKALEANVNVANIEFVEKNKAELVLLCYKT